MRRRVLTKDVAAALGISPSMASRHAKAGMPTHDLELARAWYDAHVSPSLRKDRRRPNEGLPAEKNAAEPPPPTQEEPRGGQPTTRERRELAEARLAELQLQEREGALVRRDDERRRGAALASAIVLQLEAIPDRVAAECGVDDAHRRKIRQRCAEEIDRVRALFGQAELASA